MCYQTNSSCGCCAANDDRNSRTGCGCHNNAGCDNVQGNNGCGCRNGNNILACAADGLASTVFRVINGLDNSLSGCGCNNGNGSNGCGCR